MVFGSSFGTEKGNGKGDSHGRGRESLPNRDGNGCVLRLLEDGIDGVYDRVEYKYNEIDDQDIHTCP